jgi:hypothetical protein
MPVEALKQGESELLRYVDLAEVHIREAVPLQPPPEAQVLLESSQGYLAAAWDEPHRRIAAFAFDLHDSDLPLQPSFPILVQNLVGWLFPGLGAARRPTGEVVDVPLSLKPRGVAGNAGGSRRRSAPLPAETVADR